MKSSRFYFKDQSGQSIVQALVGIGISMILVMALAAMQSMQSKENSALEQKLAALDYARSVSQILSNSKTCSDLFLSANVVGGLPKLTFNSNVVEVPANPPDPAITHRFGLRKIGDTSVGGLVSPLSRSLEIETSANFGMELNIYSVDLAKNTARGALNIIFKKSKLIRSLRDLKFPINLSTSGPLTAVKILGCKTAEALSCDPKLVLKGIDALGEPICKKCTVANIYQHPAKTCTNGTDTCTIPATPDTSAPLGIFAGCSFGWASGFSYCYGNVLNGRCPSSGTGGLSAKGSFDFAQGRVSGVHENALLCYPVNDPVSLITCN